MNNGVKNTNTLMTYVQLRQKATKILMTMLPPQATFSYNMDFLQTSDGKINEVKFITNRH